ncbi:MAG: carboxylating nicotinate-nucleotide diphosphorylase [Candidatus Gastranaerophilales bacterium]|nr:carboxylating nicotinate-nucleotide diphosphorylase [Candidatus Gastranaerophilales bacterium]
MSSMLHNQIVKKLVIQALEEDIGSGDLTTDAIIRSDQKLTAKINSRLSCTVAGIDILKLVFDILDPEMKYEIFVNDGNIVEKGQNIAIISGSAKAILTGERTALNFIQRMSAIATLTNQYQQAIKPYKAKITDTRKTTPNFRIFEKYSVKAGGGSPHRFGLYDAIMIKDNHIQAAGSLTKAYLLAKENISHTTKIEVETENIDQVKEALNVCADIIMLDNMTIDDMKQAVQIINGNAITEASGNVTLSTLNSIASTGVDYISTSAITAQAGIVDIGLDI